MTTERMLGGFTRKEWLDFLGISTADDPKLAALAATSWGGNALKMLQVNATENGWQFAAVIGLSDGDKGDITVSSSGSAWAIDNDVVSNAKLANMGEATIKGRQAGSGTGDPEDLTASQARTAMGLGTAAQKNTGTSGDAVPVLNGAATTWAAGAAFGGNVSFNDANFRAGWDGSDFANIVFDSGDDLLRYYRAGNLFQFFIAGGNVLEIGAGGISPLSTTTASGANVHQASSGSVLLRSTSSARYKTAVRDLRPDESAALLALRPVAYRSKAAADDKRRLHWGLIAEEVDAVLPVLVHRDGEGRPDAVQYERIIVGLLQIVQRQEKRLAAIEERRGQA